MSRKIIHLDAPDVARALSSVSLFDSLQRRDVEWIAQHAHILSFDDGGVIVPEGEETIGFYVVLAGSVRLLRAGKEVTVLEPGRSFGEIAPREGVDRTLSVVAAGGATVLGILRTAFKPILVRNPRLALEILEEEAARDRAHAAAVE